MVVERVRLIEKGIAIEGSFELPDLARLSVEDHGLGIASAALPHLFERSYRAPATAGRVQGLGLGLHVTRALVEAHGGQLTARNREGGGAVFEIRLPLPGDLK